MSGDRLGRTRGFCDWAGMEQDSPLRLALLTAVEAAVAAEAAVRDGARGITTEGERDLVERVARDMAARAEGLVERRTSRLAWRTALAAAAVLASGMALAAGVGYGLGWRAGWSEASAVAGDLRAALGANPASAGAWVRLMRYNDPVAALAACGKVSVVDASGWRGCNVPLWIERAGPPG